MFWERGMKKFADWLKYYNLDVELFLEALKYMRDFYTGLGLNIFKDAVSLASIAMKCFLRGTLNKRDAPELCAPAEEAYEMLKGVVVGEAEPGLLSKARGRQNENLFAQIPRREVVSKSSGLRRQRAVPKNNVG